MEGRFVFVIPFNLSWELPSFNYHPCNARWAKLLRRSPHVTRRRNVRFTLAASITSSAFIIEATKRLAGE
ncbi:hypothetical protein CEXT_195841 [Caerostris extrusa]|uniref:Uncharacterized protein n=1 Tax=Caerostris extrusa TaxID=172846 RepID=A0AAV4XBR2_CAEEX|nr:hypothetical protein CEXT_195841 [Caerostris extrusa]